MHPTNINWPIRLKTITFLITVLLTVSVSQPTSAQETVSLNLKNIEIAEILKTISDQSDYNLAIGPGVSGKVTVYLDSVPVLDAVELITELTGMAYVIDGGTIKIISPARYTELYGLQPYDKRVLRMFDLENAQVAGLVNELSKLKSAKGLILVDSRLNKLHVLETPSVLETMTQVINSADIDRQVGVFDLHHTTPATITPIIQGMLSQNATVVSDASSNRLVVLDRASSLRRIEQLVEQFDRPSGLITTSFQINHANSADLIQHIQSMLNPNTGSVFQDEISNQLIVTDLPDRINSIEQAITALDVQIPEVSIEAKIVQVSLSDNLKSGVNWQAFSDKIKELGEAEVDAGFNILSPDEQGLRFSSGLLSDDNYEFVLEALGEEGSTDLLSSPHITVINNKAAKIHVGSSVPYKTIDTREENGSIRTFEKVTTVEVGVKLNVSANINNSGYVRLDIKPEVSSVTGFSDGIPIVEKTNVETEVLIKDGVTLIIGGLIKDEVRKTKKKVPILGDIPLLGWFFSSNDNQKLKSELIIFLTPHIVTGDVGVPADTTSQLQGD